MTPEQLKKARFSLGYGVPDLAVALETPLTTVRDWEAGRARIPGAVHVAVSLLLEKSAGFDKIIRERIAAKIDRQYPGGIPSALSHQDQGDYDDE